MKHLFALPWSTQPINDEPQHRQLCFQTFIWHADGVMPLFLYCDKLRCEAEVQTLCEAHRPHCLNPDQENNNATVAGVKLMLPTHSLPRALVEMLFSFHLSASISTAVWLSLLQTIFDNSGFDAWTQESCEIYFNHTWSMIELTS